MARTELPVRALEILFSTIGITAQGPTWSFQLVLGAPFCKSGYSLHLLSISRVELFPDFHNTVIQMGVTFSLIYTCMEQGSSSSP
jgi:hypothetical protein